VGKLLADYFKKDCRADCFVRKNKKNIKIAKEYK